MSLLDFFRRPAVTRPVAPTLPITSPVSTRAPTAPHRSWVMTDEGRGHLDYHVDGYYGIILDDGREIWRRAEQFKNLP